MPETLLTPAEFGRRLDPPLSARRVQQLAAADRIPGAVKIQSTGRVVYALPESSLTQVQRNPAGLRLDRQARPPVPPGEKRPRGRPKKNLPPVDK